VLLQALIDIDGTSTKIDNSDAAVLADRLLHDIGTRLAHSARVARQVEHLGHLVERPWQSAITDAAWLHDLGYSRQIVRTGFHPLDGARWSRDRGWASETCRLVAWHTAASVEGSLRGLDQELVAEFEPPPTLAAAAVTWADLTSSPCGERWGVARRLADILRRYPSGSIVHGAIVEARLDRKRPTPPRPGGAPAGTRPRDQRSSYVTLRVYAGVPLTQIARGSARACG